MRGKNAHKQEDRVGITLSFVFARFCSILGQPDGWGTPLEVESQILTLLEIYHLLCGLDRSHVDLTTRRYAGHLNKEVPGAPVQLALRLGLQESANDKFIQILTDFVTSEIGKKL